MKSLILAGAICALILTGCATTPANDFQAVQGLWTPITAELGGKPIPDAVLKTITLRLEGDRYEVLVAGEPDRGTYALEPAKRPKGMIVVGTDGPNRGRIFPAIYEVTDDTLRICYNVAGGKRPKKFQSAAGTAQYLVTYGRVKN